MATLEEQRRYQREWVARRRAAWFSDKVCVDCASREDLELDHVDPSTKVSNSIWSWSQVRRDSEIAKCVVRCRACHLNKTIDNAEGSRAPGAFHGSSKLSRSDVEDILLRLSQGTSRRTIASAYGISTKTVSRISTGNHWSLRA